MTTGQGVVTPPATYGRMLRVPGFRQLLISSALTRTAAQMWTVGLVLFALQRYHSPSVAGVSLFLLIFPGLLLSPIAGALLDRHGRKRLMTLDFTVAAVCLTVIVTLSLTDHLPVSGLYALLVGVSRAARRHARRNNAARSLVLSRRPRPAEPGVPRIQQSPRRSS